MLQAALPDDGYREMQEILVGDDHLGRVGRVEGNAAPPAVVHGSGYYHLALFGEPSGESPFTLAFGGHRIGRDLTCSGGKVSPTPEFIGVEPVEYQEGGTVLEPLADESSSVFAMASISWSGATDVDDVNTCARIDGPWLWIDFSNQDVLAVDGIHHHTVLRDQTTDCGGS